MSKVFDNYILEVNESVKSAIAKINRNKKKSVAPAQNPIEAIRADLHKLITKTFSKKVLSTIIELELPPPHTKADYAVASFLLAQQLSENPKTIAQKIADKIKTNKIRNIKEVTVAGPYLNITVDQHQLYDDILRHISSCGEEYGHSNINTGKIVLIDFSSPNIAKPLGIGHLRSTIIGHALANIYEWTGFGVIRDNHLGDWGTQFGELIYAYKHWGNEEAIQKNPIRELKNLYVKFHEELKNDTSLKIEARRLFGELEKGDNELLGLWKKFRDLSIIDFQKTYEKLGVDFDTYIGESYFTQDTNGIIQDCLKTGVCKKDPNSDVVFVDSLADLPSFIVRKQDGSSLYITRDLATLKYRIKTFNPDVILYVVGSEQGLNFKQLFALAKAIGLLPANIVANHIGFGMVLREGKKMSTRRGTVVELEDVLNKAAEKAKKIMLASGHNLTEEEVSSIADSVGISAILYNDLHQARETNISFDWDRMLKFEAGSSAYLQYTYVRIQSIIAKAKEKISSISENQAASYTFENKKEFDLAKKVGLFAQIVVSAQKANAPHLICTYLEELSQEFNSFYSDVPVIATEDNSLFLSRIRLIQAVATALKNGLTILGIKLPPKM